MMRFFKIGLLSISALMLIGAGFAAAKYHSRVKLKGALCDNVPCIHLHMRKLAIESVIAQRGKTPSYLAIGDSITEAADLPEICGRRPINAGIGGATTATFKTEAARLAEMANPDFIVLALGTNDAFTGQFDGFRERYTALVSSLDRWRVIGVPVPPSPKIPDVERFNREIALAAKESAATLNHVETIDGVHLAASGYVSWKQSIIDASQTAVCNP